MSTGNSAVTSSPFVTAAVYAASCGPLAWSVLLLGNALVSSKALRDEEVLMILIMIIVGLVTVDCDDIFGG